MTEQTAHHGRRIVVGVDGSPNSKTALGWAMTQARLTGAGIEVVAAWQEPARTGYSYGWSPVMYDGDSIATITEKVLAETVADVAGQQRPSSCSTPDSRSSRRCRPNGPSKPSPRSCPRPPGVIYAPPLQDIFGTAALRPAQLPEEPDPAQRWAPPHRKSMFELLDMLAVVG